MRLADDYADARFTSESGKRIVVTGDNVAASRPGFGTGGVVGKVYQYVGPNKRLDLGAQNYARHDALDADRRRGRRPLPVHRRRRRRSTSGSRTTPTRRSGRSLSGNEGDDLRVDGPDRPTFDLTAPAAPYTDLGWWKPVLGTQLIPQGINVSESNSMAIGGLVVLNDVRSGVTAYVDQVTT